MVNNINKLYNNLMIYDLSGFSLPGLEFLSHEEVETVLAVSVENGEQYEELPPSAIYASKDDLVDYNQKFSLNPIDARHLSRMWSLLRRYVLQYRRNKENGYGQGKWSITKSQMLKVESFDGMPDLFDNTGDLININLLEHCLDAGIASKERGFRGLRDQSRIFLQSYVQWRLAQEVVAVALEA